MSNNQVQVPEASDVRFAESQNRIVAASEAMTSAASAIVSAVVFSHAIEMGAKGAEYWDVVPYTMSASGLAGLATLTLVDAVSRSSRAGALSAWAHELEQKEAAIAEEERESVDDEIELLNTSGCAIVSEEEVVKSGGSRLLSLLPSFRSRKAASVS